MNCVFCKIINNEIPSYTIYEDDIVKVFLDANPATNGHCLIIPKKHYVDIEDIDNETLNHISKIAKDIKHIYEDKLNIKGLTYAQNNGISQVVKHYHLHLIPNYDGFIFTDTISNGNIEDLNKIYNKIIDND